MQMTQTKWKQRVGGGGVILSLFPHVYKFVLHLSLSTILTFDFEIFSTMWYFLFFIMRK